MRAIVLATLLAVPLTGLLAAPAVACHYEDGRSTAWCLLDGASVIVDASESYAQESAASTAAYGVGEVRLAQESVQWGSCPKSPCTPGFDTQHFVVGTQRATSFYVSQTYWSTMTWEQTVQGQVERMLLA